VPPRPLRRALRHARTRLKESREHELEALVAPEVRQALERNGIELVNYGGLVESMKHRARSNGTRPLER
jgi:hypothetical protein